jgi:tetratricopeptide (TPR) repeat protein
MYLPLVAFAIGGAMLLSKLRSAAFALVIGAFLAISLHYSLVWRIEQSLWTEAVAHAPRKVRPRIQLARTLDPPHALAALEEARRIAPDSPDVESEEGRVYLAAGMPAQALSAFGRALSLEPNDAEALQNRGAALLAMGQTEPARRDFEEALKRNPCLFEARLNLLRMGVRTEAPDSCRFTPSQKSDLASSR